MHGAPPSPAFAMSATYMKGSNDRTPCKIHCTRKQFPRHLSYAMSCRTAELIVGGPLFPARQPASNKVVGRMLLYGLSRATLALPN